MIYELRVYRVVQGRMAALLTRFEHQTLPIMVRHGKGNAVSISSWGGTHPAGPQARIGSFGPRLGRITRNPERAAPRHSSFGRVSDNPTRAPSIHSNE
jgi:hypothetical protein